MTSSTLRRAARFFGLAATLVSGLVACNSDDRDVPIEIRTLSTRADLVSGGDVMVELVVPPGLSSVGLQVSVGSRDVTSEFSVRSDGRLTGMITGLALGQSVITAQSDGTAAAELTVTNSARHGPLISGPQTRPFYCATPTSQVVSGAVPATNASGLAGTPDADCNIASEYKLYYRSTTAGCSLALPDPTPSMPVNATTVPAPSTPPANACFKPYTVGTTPGDLATTTTDSGATVPYIVRVERGTINRGIYDIAVLYDATKTSWSATAPHATWNRKVVFNFGASTGQPRRQSRPATAWSGSDLQLARGTLVAANSMSDSARNSNRVLMSETVMMMKEHIIDQYGLVRFTIGSGCSGGSINSNMTGSIQPGLLDGITTTCTYPDSETTSMEVGDCVLLVEAYQKPEWLALSAGSTQAQINAKKAAINGHPDQSACHAWFNAFGQNGRAGLYFGRSVSNTTGAITVSASATNNCELPNAAVYDPANATGTANLPRCNAWSWAESIWGKVAGSQSANDTRDNVGVQYGLKSLRDGAISAEEYVTLNEIVGGIDRDSTPRAARSTADAPGLDIAYRAGIVGSGKQLSKLAIIDMRGWDDSNITVPPGNTPGAIPIHHQWYSFAIRDRITAEAGDANNQALWRFARTGLAPPGTMALDAYNTMDAWLSALKADTAGGTIDAKVRRTRPARAANFCLLPADATQTVKVTDAAVCDADAFLKPSLSPRQVAGGPRAENILKCQLKTHARTDYAAGAFSDAQWSRLQAVFPAGVCDWSKAGVGQTAAVSPLTFKGGAGGQPLGAEPVSVRR